MEDHSSSTKNQAQESFTFASDADYQRLIDNLMEGVFRSTLQGRYLAVNKALANLLGYDSPADLINSISDIGQQLYVHPGERTQFLKLLHEHSYVRGFETQFRRKHGGTIWLSTNARYVRDESGQILYLEGTNIDISASATIRAQYQQERNLLLTLIDHLPDYIYLKDTQSRFLLTNRANLQLLGAETREQVIGRTLFDYFPPDLARVYLQDDQRVLTTGVPMLDREEPSVDKQGRTHWLSTSKIPLRKPNGEVTGLVGISRDITERKQTELAIQKLAAFPRFNPNPVYEFDAEGGLAYWNEAASEMARSLGKATPLEILPEESKFIVQECLRTGSRKLRLETHLQNRVLSWSYFPIKELNAVHCYAGDVTERYQLEAQLRQAQKMESIGQLAGGVAHDFNNILTIIQGHAALLSLQKENQPEARESLQQILTAAERAANLTRQLLLFSRRQAMQLRTHDLREIVSNVAALLRRVLGEDIQLTTDLPAEPLLVLADRGMLEQVLMNLAINARDALPQGGRLTLRAENRNLAEPYPAVAPELLPGCYAVLQVDDTGTGISPESLPHIFEPFFTTKEVGKGTGLGLATVYGIVKQHHGHIEVESQVGKGTKFTVILPRQSETGTASHAATNALVQGGNETILVVEDEQAVRSLVRNALVQFGYQVVEAENGPMALRVFRELNRGIDLVITDMVMPEGMSGKEVYELLSRDKPGLKVIFTTGYSPETLRMEGLITKDARFLPKPYHPLAIARLVRSLLDDRT